MATKTTGKSTRAAEPSSRYLELVRECPLLPIKSEAELTRAIAMTRQLAPRRDLSAEEEGYLLVLADLIETYEDEHHAIEVKSSPAKKLRSLLHESGITAYRLSKETGIGHATISEILAGKSNVGPTVRRKLAARFKVKESAFV